jgi:hypothetical protein
LGYCKARRTAAISILWSVTHPAYIDVESANSLPAPLLNRLTIHSIANPQLNDDPGAIIAFPDETFGPGRSLIISFFD